MNGRKRDDLVDLIKSNINRLIVKASKGFHNFIGYQKEWVNRSSVHLCLMSILLYYTILYYFI
jgi:hypothetical protein